MDFSKKVKAVLFEIGLTEIQAEFYLYLLKSGGSTVSKVAKSLEINRTNSYAILDKLKMMNLVVEENKVTGKVVFAKSYEPILEALNQKSVSVSSYKDTINSLVPAFNSFVSNSSFAGPKIRTYESKREFDSLLEDILSNKNGEILLFTNQATEPGFFSKKAHDEFIHKRVANNIKIKVLAIDNPQGNELKKSDKKYLRQTRLLPNSFDFSTEIYIYNGKVTMIDVKEDIIGVIIESSELYKIHAQFFDFLFDS